VIDVFGYFDSCLSVLPYRYICTVILVSSYSFRLGSIFCVSCVPYLFFIKVKFSVSEFVYVFICVHCLERLSPK